jgi:hypothetical protein
MKVEKLWPLCYGKAEMPSSKLIVKEFVLDVVAKKLQKPISWATFVEKTNTN